MEQALYTKCIINDTTILLDDKGDGKGKVIVDSAYNTWSYYWGSMGESLIEFLKKIDSDYFAKNLCNEMQVFSSKLSVRAIRRHIKQEMKWELPWHEFMSGQKEMREKLREMEAICENQYQFVDMCHAFTDNLMCLDMNYNEEKEFKQILDDSVFKNEPWCFIDHELSSEYKFLRDLHKKLVKELL